MKLKKNNKSLIEKIVSFPTDKVFSLANSISNIFSELNYKSPSLICGGKNINELFLSENNLESNKNENKLLEVKDQKALTEEKKIENKFPNETFEEIQYENIKNQYKFYVEQKKFINNLEKII